MIKIGMYFFFLNHTFCRDMSNYGKTVCDKSQDFQAYLCKIYAYLK